MLVLRRKTEITAMRHPGDLAARAIGTLRHRVRPGAGLDELDRNVGEYLISNGARSPYKGYQPSPSVPPLSRHDLRFGERADRPRFYRSQEVARGDSVGIDVGAIPDGWVGDACYTYGAGEVSPRAGGCWK